MRQHKVDWGPGYRFFICEECLHEWIDVSRDCTSPSGDSCPECNEFSHPYDNEKHFEWETNGSGNLINVQKHYDDLGTRTKPS